MPQYMWDMLNEIIGITGESNISAYIRAAIKNQCEKDGIPKDYLKKRLELEKEGKCD